MSDPNHKEGGTPEWVSCEHSISLLMEYLDGTLPPDDQKALDRHFKACPPCIDFLRKYKSTPSLCKRAMVDELPEELAGRLTSFLHGKLK